MTTERRGLRAGRGAASAAAVAPPPVTQAVTIAAVTHEIGRRRSIVTLIWPDDPEKKLALPIPYGCPLDAVPAAAAAALKVLSAELATIAITPL